MLHQPNETSIKLFVSFHLVLELRFLVPVELLFVHGEGQAVDQLLDVKTQRQLVRLHR